MDIDDDDDWEDVDEDFPLSPSPVPPPVDRNSDSGKSVPPSVISILYFAFA